MTQDAKVTLDEAVAIIRLVDRRCRGPLSEEALKEKNALLSQGNLEEASAVDAAGRAGCGADFNEIVVNGKWDGQVHPYKCPACGLEGIYRAPAFDFAEEG